ncbi:MAG: hypothetical protein WC399_02365 [Bacilli bacterium]|jgi:hypothetical protein
MDQRLIAELEEYLSLQHILRDSPEYYEQLHVDETMRRLKIQARLRLKRTMAVNEFGPDQGTFFFLLRSYNRKKRNLDAILEKSRPDEETLHHLKTESGYKPAPEVTMRILLAMEFSEMDARNFLNEADMSFRPYEYLDLIVLFCLRKHIYDLNQVNELLALHGVAPL